MRVECAVLCDAASLPDGLLHVLGAGITNVTFTGFTARLPVTFALRLVLPTNEVHSVHTLRLSLADAMGGEPVARLEAGFEVEDPRSAREEAALVAPVPLTSFEIPRAGRYLLDVTLDDRALGVFPLRAVAADAPRP